MKDNGMALRTFEFFFPRVCLSCGEVLKGEKDICDECRKKLFVIEAKKSCPHCGLIKPDCDCRYNIYYFAGAAAPFFNKDTAKNIVYRYKLSNKPYYVKYLAKEMFNTLKEKMGDIEFDYITCVPMSFTSYFKRGYDQTFMLAKEISKMAGVRARKDIIGCRRFVQSQHTSNYDERFENVRHKYYIRKYVKAKNILLIDDIKTTGATLNACARELLYSGAQKVYCLTALTGVGKRDEKK